MMLVPEPLKDKRIAVQEYGIPNRELVAGFESRGATVTTIPIYRWALPEDLEPLRGAIRKILNSEVDVALFTGLGEGRNWVNVCASDAIIAIGGGFGTLSEIALALKARKPLVLLGSWSFEMDGVETAVARTVDPAEAVALAFAALAARAAAPR